MRTVLRDERGRWANHGARVAIPEAIAYRKARSNTGLVGISETVVRHSGRTLQCFAVSWREADGQPKATTIYFGNVRTREAALQRAQEVRAAGLEKRKAVLG